jgi:hypothetical protein
LATAAIGAWREREREERVPLGLGGRRARHEEGGGVLLGSVS